MPTLGNSTRRRCPSIRAPELSLLLASRSARLSPSNTGEDALRQALLTSRVRDRHVTGGRINELGYSRSGEYIAATSDDGKVYVWSTRSGREILSRDVGADGGVSFDRQRDRIVLQGRGGLAVVVALPSGDVVCRLDAGTGAATDAVIGRKHVVTARNGIGYVWDAGSCELLHTIERIGETPATVVASPNGAAGCIRLGGRFARILEVADGQIIARLEHPGEITSLAFSDNATRVVTGGRDRLARIWRARTGAALRELAGHQGQVLDVAIGPGGTEVATASTDGTARIWEAATGALRALLFGHTNYVRSVAFSPDG